MRESKALAELPEEITLEDFKWNAYPAEFDISRKKEIIEKYITNFPELEAEGLGLFFSSRTRGSGKTFLAGCVGGELINRYEASVAKVNVSDLLDISKEEGINRLISSRILILDDLGQKQTGIEWLTDILFRIIDKRYQWKKVTIVTSNQRLTELDFDDRIIDRLNSMTISVNLPEYCVRAVKANNRKTEILKRLGIE